MSDLDFCLNVLRVLDIEEVTYRLDGGGDSGTVYLEAVMYRDGREVSTLPKITIGITCGGYTITLADWLLDLIYDIPDGDWINNEGGRGNVRLRPFEADGQVLCAITYGEEGTDEPDFDDDECPDTGFDDRGPELGTIMIDDVVLQSEQGEKS
jgi:hypothetical protein